MRIFFLHGFGEKPGIFDKIVNEIPGEKILPDLWEFTGNRPRPELNVILLAEEIAAHYNLTENDIVVGHSMGGWIGIHLKQITGCKTIQIASWTHPSRVALPIRNHKIIFAFLKYGLYLNRLTEWYFVRKGYRDKPSKEVFQETFRRLRKGNRHNVTNQMRVILTPVPPLNIHPDARIHTHYDPIIRRPEEPFHQVNGDHFALYTHPEEVFPLIKKIIYPES
ncbi:MAG: alpha/beta hydrolase [Bacteroidia bacterium]|nr:alpha/beta hydrolase [Bacteroidia bacterium]